MTRTVFAVCLFVLLLPGRPALAGPPEKVSGRMVLDEVADGLRKYRKMTDPEAQIRMLGRLARTRDPRVAVLLGEVVWIKGRRNAEDCTTLWAAPLFSHYFVQQAEGELVIKDIRSVVKFSPPWRWDYDLFWWEKNEAELRHRARQLP